MPKRRKVIFGALMFVLLWTVLMLLVVAVPSRAAATTTRPAPFTYGSAPEHEAILEEWRVGVERDSLRLAEAYYWHDRARDWEAAWWQDQARTTDWMWAYSDAQNRFLKEQERRQDLEAALFGLCQAGPAVPVPAACAPVDYDHDGDVDQADFGMWQLVRVGS